MTYSGIRYDVFLRPKNHVYLSLGLLRYFLSQNCLGDVMQTAHGDLKVLRQFYTEGALIRHGAMAHVVESLYALYNIKFCINPVSQTTSDLDINWPHMSSRILPMASMFHQAATASDPPPSVPYHAENIQKWLSSGIGSASEKAPSDRHSVAESGPMSQKEAEMEEKQEIMARVITDLEIKNSQLETQLNITEAELKLKPDNPPDRYVFFYQAG